jgi:hypothetical protein
MVADARRVYALLHVRRLEVFKMLLSSFFPARVHDSGGARHDRVRSGHADRGGSGRLVGGLLLAAAYRSSTRRCSGVGVPDRQDQRDGVLAVRGSSIFLGRSSRCWAARS